MKNEGCLMVIVWFFTALFVAALNIAILAAVVWAVIEVLRWTGVIA